MKRLIKPLVVLAVLAGVAFGVVRYLRANSDDGDQVPTVVVGKATLVRQVQAEGNLRAVKATMLSVPKTGDEWGAMKVAWLATDGSHVKKDEVVVKFDRTDDEKKLVDGQADLASADARQSSEQIKSKAAVQSREDTATLAKQELERAQKFQQKDQDIYSKHDIIESEIDESLAKAKEDHAEKTKTIEKNLSRSKAALIAVEQQKAKLAISHAKKSLESMEIHAPHDGIFVLQRNWRGDVAKVGDQMWPGQTVGEIPLLETMEVEAFVLEVDGTGLAEKQKAEIVIEARPDVVYKGTIKLVDKLAKPRVGGVPIQYFAVVVSLEKTDPAVMKPGQRVRARLLLDDPAASKESIVVPRQAILNKDGKNYVYRRTDRGEFEQVAVELGSATSGRVVVKSGLAEGDRIALRDPTRSLDQALGPGSNSPPTGGGGGGGGGGMIIMMGDD